MAFETKSGGKKNSKFRAARADRAYDEGQRAQANAEKATPTQSREEELEEQIAPGIHDKVHALASEEHGPAVEVHMLHDHAAGMHHVHSIHPDGHEEHSDHADAPSAHMAAGDAVGASAGESDPEGNYPEGNEPPKSKKKKHHAKPEDTAGDDTDDFESPSLDDEE